MKKVLISLAAVFTVLILSRVTIKAQLIEAQSQTSSSVSYRLPYPGILPDNPLYKLKVLRDKIMLLLINDPYKKAQFLLNLANKQILSSNLLVDKGNFLLAKDTALKGENEITLLTFVFKNSNLKPPKHFLDEMNLATKKHQELLRDDITKVPQSDKETFNQVSEFSQRNLEELQNLVRDN